MVVHFLLRSPSLVLDASGHVGLGEGSYGEVLVRQEFHSGAWGGMDVGGTRGMFHSTPGVESKWPSISCASPLHC